MPENPRASFISTVDCMKSAQKVVRFKLPHIEDILKKKRPYWDGNIQMMSSRLEI